MNGIQEVSGSIPLISTKKHRNRLISVLFLCGDCRTVQFSADLLKVISDKPSQWLFDVIDLPEADYLMFQGEPFAEEDYCDAITAVQQAMDGYDPAVIGYVWDDSNPRIQLEPRGNRGYIELRAICRK